MYISYFRNFLNGILTIDNTAPTLTEMYDLSCLVVAEEFYEIDGLGWRKWELSSFSSICNVPNLDLEIADQCQYWLEGVILVSYSKNFFSL